MEAVLRTDSRYSDVDGDKTGRIPNAAFNAMKERLDAGTVATWVDLQPVDFTGAPQVPLAMRRAPLPSVRPSFFGVGERPYAIALRPFTVRGSGTIAVPLVEALSAAQQVPYRTRRWRPVGFAYFGAIGVWDVSFVDVAFDRPVVIHGITGRGAATGFTINSLVAPLGQQPCVGENIEIRGQAVNGVWRDAIAAWVGKSPPNSKAIVNMRSLSGVDAFEKVMIESVDVDADGVPDFSLWAGREQSDLTDDPLYWKAVVVNVGGTWLPLALNYQPDCT
jgi:hypothetical protein